MSARRSCNMKLATFLRQSEIGAFFVSAIVVASFGHGDRFVKATLPSNFLTLHIVSLNINLCNVHVKDNKI